MSMKRANIKSSGKTANKSSGAQAKPTNQYLLAFMTAVLAGLFSVGGGYFVARFQTNAAIVQKQVEYRVNAYSNFLEKLTKARLCRSIHC